jgi:hypothetical protein
MFTWICPQCGKEVQPHETECPWCAEAAKAPPASAASAAPPAQPSTPSAETPRQPAAQRQPVVAVAARKGGLPGWAVTLIVAAVLMGGGYLVYQYGLNRKSAASSVPTAPNGSPFEAIPAAGESSGGGKLGKNIEATGFRITQDNDKRIQVQFLIVNHTGADVGDLAGTVHLKSTVDDSEYASVDFKTTRLGPYESIEFKAIVSTMKRVYDFPDWQLMRGVVEITSPADL